MAEVKPDTQLKKSLGQIFKPAPRSHKGQNGRLLIIGGSKIFHAASLWSAEIASHFVDLVHYASTTENETVFLNLKSKFTNGIVIPKEKLLDYLEEDDVILIGPGMERGKIEINKFSETPTFEEIIKIENEAEYTYVLIKFLIEKYPQKQFVFDAAALQMMNPDWMKLLQTKAIVTPHTKEFQKLFGVEITDQNKQELVGQKAQEFHCIILLKDVEDFISDGTELVEIVGGNEGLAKGGSGDVLAGLVSSFACKSNVKSSAVIASYIVKTAAESLYKDMGPYFNTSQLIQMIPIVSKKVLFDNT